MAIVINGSGTVTGISVGGLPDGIVDAGTLATNSVDSAELIDGAVDDSHMASISGRKNMIINGAMTVSQRNGTTDTTVASGAIYTIDRWKLGGSQSSKLSVQQSTVAPTGFKNSAKITVQSAVSIGNGDYFGLCTDLEGQDVAHLSFGSASAQQVTLSFWVRSSLTGTFGFALREQCAGSSRSYATNYAISSADTWEKKTITISGDESGTWSTDNTAGLGFWFDLGSGSDFHGSANTWEGANDNTTSGTVSVIGTGSATWYISGVQLELGSVATDFEHRTYGEELYLCQRYYESTPALDAATSARQQICFGSGALQGLHFDVRKRAVPTVVVYGRTGVAGSVSNINSGGVTTSCAAENIVTDGCHYISGSGFTTGVSYEVNYSADAEL